MLFLTLRPIFSTGNEKQSRSLKNPQWKQQEKAKGRGRESKIGWRKSEAKVVDSFVAFIIHI